MGVFLAGAVLSGIPEERRLRELASRARFTGQASFTRFLEPDGRLLARSAALEADVQVAFYGGHPDAERSMAAFFVEAAPMQIPAGVLEIRWNAKYGQPGHRDLLGALMGLGVSREMLGDLAVGEGRAVLFSHADVSEYILRNLDAAGRVHVAVSRAGEDAEWPPPEGRAFRATVSSARLDAVLAAGFDLSRQQAQGLISAGAVKLNHLEQTHADARLRDGDLLSARGLGRVRLEEVLGETRKGRLAIRLFRYGK